MIENIENFLGVKIPLNLRQYFDNNSSHRLLEINHILDVLKERPPFLKIEKAVYLKEMLLSTAAITETQCEGHFPHQLIVPLIKIAEVMAQSGVLLVSLHYQKTNVIPIAIGSGESKTLTQKFLYPPLKLLIKTDITRGSGSFYVIDGKAYTHEGQEAAQLSAIKYLVLPQEKVK